MITRGRIATIVALFAGALAHAGERQILSLKDLSQIELKYAGIELSQKMTVRVKALGGGGGSGWNYKSNQMYAYGWILNADTRKLVWKMDVDNTSRSGDDREFNGDVTLEPGSYEIYFSATTFEYHSAFSHLSVNIDHRDKPLFGSQESRNRRWFNFFTDWFSDDLEKDWKKRAPSWGIELSVDDAMASSVTQFTPPKELPNIVLKRVGAGEDVMKKEGFSISAPTTLDIYALGEGRNAYEMYDFGWIVNTVDRSRVWEMQYRGCDRAGGADKNMGCSSELRLDKGDYVLYYVTDDSHSPADWNANPPYDPLNWGVTLSIPNESEKKNFKLSPYTEDQNVILSITKVGDNEHRTEGFSLTKDSKVRIYAFGERGNSKRSMADYGFIVDAKTREKVWTMDVDRSAYAGGASKNRYVDEVIDLPPGSYIVIYNTDDSHSYGDWNDKPPFDPEHYGITIMGVGEKFSKSVVTTYLEKGDRNIIAQIVRIGDDADEERRFKLDRTTRVRVYAIGEGQNREMNDYGWIEESKSGDIVWEMTYSMTFHAGGHRKNRMVNTAIVLDKGEYILHYKSDDSHSYGDWNVEPPEDQDSWGITLYKEEVPEKPPAPLPPERKGKGDLPIPPKPPR